MIDFSYEQLKQRITELEQELQLYKNFVKELPFPVEFTDHSLGMKLKKKRGKIAPTIHSLSASRETGTYLQLDINLDSDLPFEKIETFLAPILDFVPHHIVFVDGNGIITLCNLQAANDMGVNRDSVIGKHIRDLVKLPDELIVTLKSIEMNEPIYNQEVLDRYYGIINTRMIRNEDGSIKRVISMFQSLNLMKETEKLAVAGRIAAGIAHEIRNPLTTVRGYLQFLKSDLPDRIVSLIDQLLIPELDRANSIITDFLNIAKPADIKMEKIQINQFIQEELGMLLQSEGLLHNVDIRFNLDERLTDYDVEADKNQLLQVFLNLFRNAVEAKVKKTMNVSISSKLHNNIVQIQFCDDGPGIPPTIIDHIFDPFFSTKETGTGLGLSLSHKIIELHKGTMKVQSSECGTCFFIELPIVKARLS
ncbi:two-component system sensor histidine kinase NtrB [Thermaerobacillus caldiproteolyticus]|uniref:two-component system sensor histidine kinase NtrB n=1 Tax=Thermaerobacillus caldiproteolyticus TaxID=247480 RepID=UPI00188A1187|nr:ATP-binding protein [Anoxybacillus caldiproteolyticus]QPA32680.1 PAS domain-containing protein [Anoxybacillus caldiproteolyticus]